MVDLGRPLRRPDSQIDADHLRDVVHIEVDAEPLQTAVAPARLDASARPTFGQAT
jgi:hypothetical protein